MLFIHSIVYCAKQSYGGGEENLPTLILLSLKAAADADRSDADDEEELLTVRHRTKEEKECEEKDYILWLKGEEDKLNQQQAADMVRVASQWLEVWCASMCVVHVHVCCACVSTVKPLNVYAYSSQPDILLLLLLLLLLLCHPPLSSARRL